jgi:hypothetical protein
VPVLDVRLGATVKIDVSDNEPSAGPSVPSQPGVDGFGFEGEDCEDAFDAPERSLRAARLEPSPTE